MILLLNILLLISAFLLAILAIGGETWQKSESKASGNLTFRGWGAIAVLLLSLGIGIAKEYFLALEEDSLKARNASMLMELRDTKMNLENAKEEISELIDLLTNTPSNIEIYEQSGWRQIWEKKFSEALDTFSRGIELNPEYSYLWEGKAYAFIGLAFNSDFDVGSVSNNEYVSKLVKRNDIDNAQLQLAGNCARQAFLTAGNDGEKAAAVFLDGFISEIYSRGKWTWSGKYKKNASTHYLESRAYLESWMKDDGYEKVTDPRNRYKKKSVLPWWVAWQARSIRPISTYSEAIEAGIDRRFRVIAQNDLVEMVIVTIDRTFDSPGLAKHFKDQLIEANKTVHSTPLSRRE